MKKTLGPHPQRNKKGGRGKEMKQYKADTISPRICVEDAAAWAHFIHDSHTGLGCVSEFSISTTSLHAGTEIKGKRKRIGVESEAVIRRT